MHIITLRTLCAQGGQACRGLPAYVFFILVAYERYQVCIVHVQVNVFFEDCKTQDSKQVACKNIPNMLFGRGRVRDTTPAV